MQKERDNTFQCCMCLETFDKQKKYINCTKCNSHSCTTCFRLYISHCRNDPPCPDTSCDYIFKICDLRDKLPQAFWNGAYKESRKEVLYNFEEVYKFGTMGEVQKTKDIRKIDDKIKQATEQYVMLKRQLHKAKIEIDNLSDDRHYLQYASYSNKETRESIKHRVPCHVNSCMGFCIGDKCQVCEAKTCSKCHKELTETHECNQHDVETVQEISKNTRPCPTCNTAISKVDGCDQMLCITCETAFSWRTGKIETGRIHNPHLYQIRNRVGRELGDEVCGGLPSWRDLSLALRYTPTWTTTTSVDSTQRSLMILHRLINHIRAIVFPRFENLTLNFSTNLKHRILFYMNEITKEKYTKELVKTEKNRTKNLEMRDLFQTFVTVAEEIFRKIYNTKQKKHIRELYGLIEYLNENYYKINSKYKSTFRLENFISFSNSDFDTLMVNSKTDRGYLDQPSTSKTK